MTKRKVLNLFLSSHLIQLSECKNASEQEILFIGFLNRLLKDDVISADLYNRCKPII